MKEAEKAAYPTKMPEPHLDEGPGLGPFYQAKNPYWRDGSEMPEDLKGFTGPGGMSGKEL